MQLFFSLVTLFTAPLVSASPAAHKKVDILLHCGEWDSVTAGNYMLLLNQWGASGATTGSQCAQITTLSGNTIAWTTKFDWVGGKDIKGFTNIQLNTGINKQLNSINSMPASWTWSMSSTSVVADVAFDLFTSNSAGGSNVNEVMIWLANYNSGPISYHYNAEGVAQAVATNIPIAGYTWNLYVGSNGRNKVFSFLPASGVIMSFSDDIYPFFRYLMLNQGVASSQYLITAQAGSEATTGSATLATSQYSLVINQVIQELGLAWR